MDKPRRVVITGSGIICPLGNDVRTVWNRLLAGESGIGAITKFDASRLTSRIAGEVRDFDPEDFMEKRAVRRMDAFSQYAVAAARQAAQDAGLDVAAEPELIEAIVASGVGGLGTFEQQARVLLTEGPRRLSAFLAPMTLPNMAAAQVSLELGLKGPLSAVCTACSAGANAIGDAGELMAVVALGYPATRASGPKKLPLGALVRYLD